MNLLLRTFSYTLIILLPGGKLLFGVPQLSAYSVKRFQESLCDFLVLCSQASIACIHLEESPSHLCLGLVIKISEEPESVVRRAPFSLDLFDCRLLTKRCKSSCIPCGYFWLPWVSRAACGLLWLAAGRVLFVEVRGLLPPWSAGPEQTGFSCRPPRLSRCGLSCSMAVGVFPAQGLNPCSLHWQADFYPLRHQGSLTTLD